MLSRRRTRRIGGSAGGKIFETPVNFRVADPSRVSRGRWVLFSPQLLANALDLTYNYVYAGGHNNGKVMSITNALDSTRPQDFKREIPPLRRPPGAPFLPCI